MSTPPTALLLTGGHSHPAELSVGALTEIVSDAGLETVVSEDPDGALTSLVEADPALLVVNTLRWRMGHPRYAEFREEWAFSLSVEARTALIDWVDAGGRLLALHSALVSFDDWPEWGDLIGASWDWPRSHHPPVGPVDVVYRAGSPLAEGLEDFTVTDECYVDLDLRPGNEIVATMRADGCPPQPASWLRAVGDRRSATSTLGHDRRSLDHRDHRVLLGRLIGWLLAEATPHRELITRQGSVNR